MNINPLLAKELRLRMRTWRSFGTVFLYLLVLGGFALLFFASFHLRAGWSYMDLSQLGRNLFNFLAMLQFALIFFLVPGLTATLISSEHERQTFDLLVCTQLTPFNIVAGKLTAALSVIFLLILASLPLYGFVFLLGGVSPGELAVLIAILLLAAVINSSFGIMLSSVFRKPAAAVIGSYVLSLALVGGTLLLNGLTYSLFHNYSPLYPLLLLNPLVLFEWLHPQIARDALNHLSRGAYPWRWLSFWQVSVLVNFALAAASLYIAAWKVNPLRAGKKSG
jgi:ABC-type transport system involved in multi-copper enzyme maturation permease subunit